MCVLGLHNSIIPTFLLANYMATHVTNFSLYDLNMFVYFLSLTPIVV
jgi:hypothetical protein